MDNFDYKKYLAEGKLYENDGNIKFINKFNPSQKIIDMYNENPHLKKPLSSLSKYKKIRAIAQLQTHFSTSKDRDMIKKEDRFDSSLADIIEAWADDYYKDSDFFSYGMYVDKDYFDFFNANKDLLLKKYKKQQIPYINEEIKFIDYLTVDQDEFKPLYDKHYDDDGHMEDFEEDFIEDFGVDFLSPNIEKIKNSVGFLTVEEVKAMLKEALEAKSNDNYQKSQKILKEIEENADLGRATLERNRDIRDSLEVLRMTGDKSVMMFKNPPKDKKILEDSLILFIKKIPPGTRRKRLTQK